MNSTRLFTSQWKHFDAINRPSIAKKDTLSDVRNRVTVSNRSRAVGYTFSAKC